MSTVAVTGVFLSSCSANFSSAVASACNKSSAFCNSGEGRSFLELRRGDFWLGAFSVTDVEFSVLSSGVGGGVGLEEMIAISPWLLEFINVSD